MYDYLHAERIKGTHSFDNRRIFGIYLSRFGASWLGVGGRRSDRSGFEAWMKQLEFQDGDKIAHIQDIDPYAISDAYEIMTCGKLELEENARRFISARKK